MASSTPVEVTGPATPSWLGASSGVTVNQIKSIGQVGNWAERPVGRCISHGQTPFGDTRDGPDIGRGGPPRTAPADRDRAARRAPGGTLCRGASPVRGLVP